MLRPAVLVLAAAVYAAAEPPAGEFCGEPSTKGIVAALETDDFKCALSLIKAVGVDVNVNEVMMGLRSVEGRVKEIKDAVKATQHDPTKFLAPAHQWAQSGGEIFLSVKFAHKWDAPATLVSAEDIEEVAFEAEKVVVKASKAEKRFVLEVPLLREIDPAASSYVTASVGRMTITLKKASSQREWWPRLNKDKTKPANQGVWWDKQELYDKEKEEVQKQEKAKGAPKGLASKLEAMKKKKTAAAADAEVEQAKREDMGADEAPEAGGGEAPQDDNLKSDKNDRSPFTSAVKRSDKRKKLAHSTTQQAKEKLVEEARERATKEQARVKLDIEDLDRKLEWAYKQIDADIPKDAADPAWDPVDVPSEFPDVPEAQAAAEKKTKKKKKKKKAKKAEGDL
jgi:hypothetical protein